MPSASDREHPAASYALVSLPVALMPERVVTTYDTREEAEDALAWYERTYAPPRGSLFVREVEADAAA